MAGVDWLPSFLKMHPDISLRKPEATFAAPAMGFNKVAVSTFLFFGKIIDEHHLTPDKIYNVDETGITVNPKGQSKTLALKSRRQVGVQSSAEKGETVTFETCFFCVRSFHASQAFFPENKCSRNFN
jgi:hypothetical protein